MTSALSEYISHEEMYSFDHVIHILSENTRICGGKTLSLLNILSTTTSPRSCYWRIAFMYTGFIPLHIVSSTSLHVHPMQVLIFNERCTLDDATGSTWMTPVLLVLLFITCHCRQIAMLRRIDIVFGTLF